MSPDPVNKDTYIDNAVYQSIEIKRQLEAHGKGFGLAPVAPVRGLVRCALDVALTVDLSVDAGALARRTESRALRRGCSGLARSALSSRSSARLSWHARRPFSISLECRGGESLMYRFIVETAQIADFPELPDRHPGA